MTAKTIPAAKRHHKPVTAGGLVLTVLKYVVLLALTVVVGFLALFMFLAGIPVF